MDLKLIIAEKNSVAKTISAVLSSNERGDGYLHGGEYIVTWCVGHLVELAEASVYDEKYAKWRLEDLPIIPHEWKYSAAKDKAKQLKIIADLMKKPEITVIICATDAGREGELIFRLVYNYCKCAKPIKRLWVNSLEESTILNGFKNLRNGADYDNLYHAALCRSQADYLVGINATRFFSCIYADKLNVGRVMSPTLALIVERETAIKKLYKRAVLYG